IDGAARDVQAAINAARMLLPTGLPTNPVYRKVNPADAPIMILALTSDTRTQGQMYDAASTILAQKLSQLQGVGQVTVGGSSLRASIPSDLDLDLVLDRTPTIRGSLRDTERTLMIAIVLVILVVFLFLRDWRATLIPSVAVPVSLVGTFGVMYLCRYSLNNLSL